MDYCPIVATAHEIWAVNLRNRERLKLAQAPSEILDVYVSPRGVYHSFESQGANTKYVTEKRTRHVPRRVKKSFPFNFVQINDTVAGEMVTTAYPPRQDTLPLEKRMIPLTFEFFREEGSLCYTLNGDSHVLWNNFPEQPITGNFEARQGRLYFNPGEFNFRISGFVEPIQKIGLLDEKELRRLLRRKNPGLIKKYSGFWN